MDGVPVWPNLVLMKDEGKQEPYSPDTGHLSELDPSDTREAFYINRSKICNSMPHSFQEDGEKPYCFTC